VRVVGTILCVALCAVRSRGPLAQSARAARPLRHSPGLRHAGRAARSQQRFRQARAAALAGPAHLRGNAPCRAFAMPSESDRRGAA